MFLAKTIYFIDGSFHVFARSVANQTSESLSSSEKRINPWIES